MTWSHADITRGKRGPKVVAVEPPPSSTIADWYARADLLDSFATRLSPGTRYDARMVAERMLGRQPAWVRLLMKVRDGVMAKLGVATAAEIRTTLDGNERIGFFPVVSSHAGEVVVGYDDRHLDFRTSILILHEPAGDLLIGTTVVRCRNLLGRAYLWIIRPFHVAIVRDGLRRTSRIF